MHNTPSFWDFFREAFRRPTAVEHAQRELELARLQVLRAASEKEYYAKQEEFYAGVVTRLTRYLQEESRARGPEDRTPPLAG